jgi:hypothetical protein
MWHLPKIDIKVIPHKEQRYDTVGDWQYSKRKISLQISQMELMDYEFMVAIHELIEVYLCKKAGITTKEVDDFDMANSESDDPGRSPKAPYHKEHMFAMKIEHMICKFLFLSWDAYNHSFERLVYKDDKKEK